MAKGMSHRLGPAAMRLEHSRTCYEFGGQRDENSSTLPKPSEPRVPIVTLPDFRECDGLRVAGFVATMVAVWTVSGWLKGRHFIRAGDARKINHTSALVGGAACFGWLPLEAARATY